MKKIRIPDTELELAPVGMGCVNAGLKWDGKEADNLFDAFVDMGGNLYDTARVYSDWIPDERGRSERVIGDWLRRSGKRDRVVLVTKGGHPDMTVQHPDMHENRLTRADMQHDLDLSLQALGTDYIDLYFFHRDHEELPVQELIETMESFVKAGKIRYYGCSNWSTERMEEADSYCREQGYGGFAANQALYNIGCRYMKPMADDTLAVVDSRMADYHRRNPQNLAMPYMGLCSGFFHSLIQKGEKSVEKSEYYTEDNLKVKDQILKVMEKYHATVTQAVLGFFAVQQFVCLPLYGPRSAENMKEALDTFEIPFEKQDYVI